MGTPKIDELRAQIRERQDREEHDRAMRDYRRGVARENKRENDAYNAGRKDATSPGHGDPDTGRGVTAGRTSSAPRAVRRAVAAGRRTATGGPISATGLGVVALGLVLLYLFLTRVPAVYAAVNGALRWVTSLISPSAPAIPQK